MSGGSYDYAYTRVDDMAGSMMGRHFDHPLRMAFARHLERVAKAMRAVEWADSGDTSWDADLDAMLRAIVTPADELHEATRQAREAHAALAAALDRSLSP